MPAMRPPLPSRIPLVILLLCSIASAQINIQELKKRAEAGDAKSQNDLGVAYHLGHGVLKDDEAALRWYQEAAKQNNADGLFNLGITYFNGDGVNADPELAYAWLAIAG